MSEETPASPAKKPAAAIPFDELAAEIKTFLAHVDAGYYFAPNRVVPKQKRSKWRFEMMRFLKGLEAHASEEAADLYLELYKRLAYGCGIYIFPSEDPFRAIGTRQAEFYPKLAIKYFSNGFSDKKILEMLRAATSVYIDRESLYIEFEIAFIRELKTRDMREKAYNIAKEEIRRLEALPKGRYDHDNYEISQRIDEICITIIGLGIAIYEEAPAVEYYWKHDRERSEEVKLFVALNSISCFGGGNELWIRVYDEAVKRGVKPRESLIKERKAIRTP